MPFCEVLGATVKNLKYRCAKFWVLHGTCGLMENLSPLAGAEGVTRATPAPSVIDVMGFVGFMLQGSESRINS